uniref:Uncharacterized protein n=1 Tax=Nymphaea colorata TaxID=210225 RepID=A0A5K0XVU2_9MAGN
MDADDPSTDVQGSSVWFGWQGSQTDGIRTATKEKRTNQQPPGKEREKKRKRGSRRCSYLHASVSTADSFAEQKLNARKRAKDKCIFGVIASAEMGKNSDSAEHGALQSPQKKKKKKEMKNHE